MGSVSKKQHVRTCTPICTHSHIYIWGFSLVACMLVNTVMPPLPNFYTTDLWYHPGSQSPWRWELATDTAGSMKSLLSFGWGQQEPIRKPQWFYVLLWAITCSFSCCPPPYLVVLSFWLGLVRVPDLVKHPSRTQRLVWHPGIRLNCTLHLCTTVLGSDLLVAIQWVGVKS